MSKKTEWYSTVQRHLTVRTALHSNYPSAQR